ncbi:hypothetical protein EQG49_06625 [Periweissella cryptocerci]|uniref:Uncharacterized protein n=1 Tax=Periweissella cryptocerci TaxID=2506420 RepID=A0A4P6YTY4_9LACO|nr:hypothetical protein [Periweissella cryptocerci]QBO36156.1 hypothetical protein EQG49_06625 [Periweissella cryptocerci]
MNNKLMQEINKKLSVQLTGIRYIDVIYHIAKVALNVQFKFNLNEAETLVAQLLEKFFKQFEIVALLQTNPKLGVKVGFVIAAAYSMSLDAGNREKYLHYFLNSELIKNSEYDGVKHEQLQLLHSLLQDSDVQIKKVEIVPGQVTVDDIELLYLGAMRSGNPIENGIVYSVYLYRMERYTELLELLSVTCDNQTLINILVENLNYKQLSISELISLALLSAEFGGAADGE